MPPKKPPQPFSDTPSRSGARDRDDRRQEPLGSGRRGRRDIHDDTFAELEAPMPPSRAGFSTRGHGAGVHELEGTAVRREGRRASRGPGRDRGN